MKVEFPSISTLYDLIVLAGESFKTFQLKRLSVFFPDGKKYELEVVDGRSGRIRYQKVMSSIERTSEYLGSGDYQSALMKCYDDASEALTLLQRGRSPVVEQVFVRLYGAVMEQPVVYRYKEEGQKFYKSNQ